MTAVLILVRRSELFQPAKCYEYELAGYLLGEASILDAGAAEHTRRSRREHHIELSSLPLGRLVPEY